MGETRHRLPRLLVIDDLFGRDVVTGRNLDRENLCAHFLWHDATDDSAARASQQKVLHPIAEAVFCRGQTPPRARVGDVVENDLSGTLEQVARGEPGRAADGTPGWAMVVVDLCFYTGRVTPASDARCAGMPPGRPADDDPTQYFGLTLIDAIHRRYPSLPIVVLSSKPRDEVSREFSRRGALAFLARDELNGAEAMRDMIESHALLPDPSGEVIGHSLPLLLALREARRAAHLRESMLIRGERGTGKELLARYIHRASASAGRADRPFVAVNSAVLRTDLFAAELFGIEARTATGVGGKVGLVETAHGGDLFLDEIADMPAEVQAAMLRVLQEHQFTRVGSRRPVDIDVRFLSATNHPLEAEPQVLRPDLLDRLRQGGTLTLPPLRERLADLPLLVERFVRDAQALNPGALARRVDADTLELLGSHSWPGNLRELRTCIFDAVNRHPHVEHLVPGHLRITKAARPWGRAPLPGRAAESRDEPESLVATGSASRIEALLSALDVAAFPATEIGMWSGRLQELQRSMAAVQMRYLKAAIEATKRRTPEHPEGIVLIHPAVKLLTGDQSLTASKAADLVKRLLGPHEADLDEELAQALAIATRLRPKSRARISPAEDS